RTPSARPTAASSRSEVPARSGRGLVRSQGRRCSMGRTFALFAVALASLAAAAMAALLRPAAPKPADPNPVPAATAAAPGLRIRAFLERLYLPTDRDTTAYLQIDLIADADSAAEHRRAPVNAVLILDRSGSMSGVKMDRAREAARALVRALLPEDRLAIVEFSS